MDKKYFDELTGVNPPKGKGRKLRPNVPLISKLNEMGISIESITRIDRRTKDVAGGIRIFTHFYDDEPSERGFREYGVREVWLGAELDMVKDLRTPTSGTLRPLQVASRAKVTLDEIERRRDRFENGEPVPYQGAFGKW